MFFDKNKPISTCCSKSCEGCKAGEKIHCHFRPLDFIHFLLISVPGFIIGGYGLWEVGTWSLLGWLPIFFGFFIFIEIRVMCSHCPHYAEEGRILHCWANHGSLKLFKYRPGPMSVMEKVLFLGGFAAVWGYPLPFIAVTGQWFKLVLYILVNTGFFFSLKLFLCSQCMNFACPLNGVDQQTRREFFKYNPSVAEHWNEK